MQGLRRSAFAAFGHIHVALGFHLQLLVANISTNLVAYKPFWWVLALAFASGQLAPREGATRSCAA